MWFIPIVIACVLRPNSANLTAAISWSSGHNSFPEIRLFVEIPGILSVAEFSSINTLGGSNFFARNISNQSSESVPQSRSFEGTVALFGTDVRRFGWEQDILLTSNPSVDPIGTFDVSPYSHFLHAANRFMITPREFVVNPSYPDHYCHETAPNLGFFDGIVQLGERAIWGFILPSGPVFIDSMSEMIFLNPEDDARFIREVIEILHENNISFPLRPHRPWYPRNLDNCDMDLLDNILPSLQYNLDSANLIIEITPREYIRPYTHFGGKNSCYIAVASSRGVTLSIGQTIGAILFRKYAV